MTPKRKLRLVLFGIDGADWDIMRPLLEAGLLPNLGALIGRGSTAPLRSTIPPLTHLAWPSIMTGANPGKHGVFGFVTLDDRPRLFSGADRQVPALWDILTRHGLTVGVFNVPLTFPVEPVNGYMVAGEVGSPAFSNRLFHPPDLFTEAKRLVPKYPVSHPLQTLPPHRQAAEWQRLAAAREQLCLHLLSEHRPEVLLAVVNYVDQIQHSSLVRRRLGDLDDAVAWAYQRADNLLGRICDAGDEDTKVIVLSDHGAGPIEGYIDLAAFLAGSGYLRYQHKVARGGRVRRAAYTSAARLYRFVNSKLPDALALRLWCGVRKLHNLHLIEWEKTLAFYAPRHNIIVNSPGRSSSPAVSDSDRSSVAAEIASALNDTINPLTGEKDIRAYLREELYDGPALDRASDIVVMPREFRMDPITGLPGSQQVFWADEAELVSAGYSPEQLEEGNHRLDGIAIVAPALGTELGAASVLDIAPTVLSMLELPVPRYMDGRPWAGPGVLDDASEALAGEDVPRESTRDIYSDREEAAIARRLQDLGYL